MFLGFLQCCFSCPPGARRRLQGQEGPGCTYARSTAPPAVASPPSPDRVRAEACFHSARTSCRPTARALGLARGDTSLRAFRCLSACTGMTQQRLGSIGKAWRLGSGCALWRHDDFHHISYTLLSSWPLPTSAIWTRPGGAA